MLLAIRLVPIGLVPILEDALQSNGKFPKVPFS